jgi:ketosteroid isomerase-like protein
MPIDRDLVQQWLDRYIEAWRANRPEPIAELFAEDAVYRYQPYADDAAAIRGRDAIVAAWLEEPDAPDAWEAKYEPFAVDGDRAVATGWSRYFATIEQQERVYHNCYLLRFDAEGRCAEFVEYFMQVPKPGA